MQENFYLTPERESKFRKVISLRQPDLTVILENVDDPHNVLAILRTCDAVGITEVNVIRPKPIKNRLGKRSSASARKWVRVNTFSSASECCKYLIDNGFAIWATHLSAESRELYDLDLNSKVALAFGNEHTGISEELLSFSTGNFIIPMMGMIPSLNVSVACAISVYEALRQRLKAGRYDSPALSTEQTHDLLRNWSDRQ